MRSPLWAIFFSFQGGAVETLICPLKKLHDAVQFSDPMSDNDLAEIETQISVMVAKLTEAVAVADTQEVVRLSEEALILVNRRNQKCKMLK